MQRLVVSCALVLAGLLGPACLPAAAATYDSLLAPATVCANQTDTSLSIDAQEQAMLCMVIYARRQSGLPALTTDSRLMDAAGRKAQDILTCQSFSHTACGRDFTYQITQAGYPYSAAGENIAWGSGSRGNARSIMSAWLNSSGHRANILSSRYRDHGIGLAKGTLSGYSGALVWVDEFGAAR